MRYNTRTTAAWRISTWTTLAFAVGTAVAFFILYRLVAEGVRQHIDAWLAGVAELATQEVPKELNSQGQQLNSVFFLQVDPNHPEPLWVGGGSKERFVKAMQGASLVPGVPQSVKVAEEKAP